MRFITRASSHALITVAATGAAMSIALLAGAAPAWAHVHVDADNTTPGSYSVLTFNVPNESEKGALTKDREFRIGGRGRPEGKSPDSLVNDIAKRIGVEKRGNRFSLYVSLEGEPMTRYGPPIELDLKEPFYVGIGFCSHLPDVVDTATLSNVVLVNKAGKVR